MNWLARNLKGNCKFCPDPILLHGRKHRDGDRQGGGYDLHYLTTV